MARPRALFFDLDQTLGYDRTAESIAEACRAVAAAAQAFDVEQLLAANAQVWAAYWPEMEEAWTLGRLSTAELTLEAWVRTLRACDCDDHNLAELARETAYRFNTFGLFEDVLPFLDALAGRYALAVITNGASDLQREKLSSTGIEERFGAVVISGEIGQAKPEAAVFQAACSILHVGPGTSGISATA